MAYQSIRRGEEIVHGNTEADVLDDFVAVLFVDFVGYLFHVRAVEFVRWDLHQVRDGGEDEHCVFEMELEVVCLRS
jgi:hypothetical protein